MNPQAASRDCRETSRETMTDADRHFINSTNCNDAGIDLIDQHLAPEPSRLSVAGHHEWRESIAAPCRDYDEVDRALDDMIEVPWPELNPPSRRKDSEVNRVLSILDNLPTGKDEA